ncbi:MAG: hypothetical protein KC776_21655 [Myxococcales bacterium]|nr:hypothetical protein [Myxococcales bacterium]MCB9575878.1 hypothetical protein [Polyangiaceae bacterium]
MIRRASFWAAALAAACWLSSPPALADDDNVAEARRLYGEAKKAMGDKRYKEAALGFEAASKLHPHAVALYTAAQAWELAGEPGRAADAYARSLSTPKLSDSQAQRSRERLDALEKDLGVVVVTGPESTQVRLDDHIEVTLPARLHGTPGSHTLTITPEGGVSEERTVELSAGATTEIDSEATTDEPAPSQQKKKEVPLSEPRKQPVQVETKSAGPWQTIGWVATGAGVAALGGGALLGISAKDAEDTYKAAPTRETYDHAKGLESKTNIMFITGGVLTAAGVGVLIWQATKGGEKAPGSEVSLELGPQAVWAKGRF